MKTFALALLIVLACGLSAFGSDCIVTSYDNYIGTSCGVGADTFSNFSYSTAGSSQMPSSSITVNPVGSGFLFNAPWAAVGSQTQSSLIGFTANGSGINDVTLSMFGANVVGNGLVAVTENYCAGDTFADLCANGIEGTLTTYLGAGLSKLNDSATFGAVNVVDVVKSIQLIGGGNASFAVLGGVENQFSGAVPEPTSVTLMVSGVAFVGSFLARRRKL